MKEGESEIFTLLGLHSLWTVTDSSLMYCRNLPAGADLTVPANRVPGLREGSRNGAAKLLLEFKGGARATPPKQDQEIELA